MGEQVANSDGHSTAALVAAAGTSALAGLALGYAIAKRQLDGNAGPRRTSGRVSPPKLQFGSRLADSAESTPAATPRSMSRQDLAPAGSGGGLCMLLLIRTDLPLSRSEVAEQAARTLLGQFKKQYKRRDPGLRAWEEGGYRMKVLGVDSQNEMLLQQAAARALTIPTHTFAGSDRVNKQRTVMAIGPAPAEMMNHITAHLHALPG